MAGSLRLISDKAEKAAAQKQLEGAIKSALKNQGKLNIGFPSGNLDELVYSNGNGELWCAFQDADQVKIPRRWNAFGIFDDTRHSQFITVEINIPTKSNSAQVAGFFARDAETDKIYLMHDGSVGGGKKGVGRKNFLAWSKWQLEDVMAGAGDVRSGLVIGAIGDPDFPDRLLNFVKLVRGFKDTISSGRMSDAELADAASAWDEFSDEGSGRKKGKRKSDFDYISYHGDVVRHLYDVRCKSLQRHEHCANSKLVDLYVRMGERVTEVFEVKTDLGRQCLYTALGQILTHALSAGSDVRKFIVLPEGEIPDDILSSFAAFDIQLLRFRISKGKVPKVALLNASF